MNKTAASSPFFFNDANDLLATPALWIEIKGWKNKGKKEKRLIQSRVFVKGTTIIIRYVNSYQRAVRVVVFWYFYDDATDQFKKVKIIGTDVTLAEPDRSWYKKVKRVSSRMQQFNITIRDAETKEKIMSHNYRFSVIPRLSVMQRVPTSKPNLILYKNTNVLFQ